MKYFQVKSPPGKYSDWLLPSHRHKMACCDCGLVHDFQFKAVAAKKGARPGVTLVTDAPGLRVMFRAKRNRAATAAKRRENRKKSPK